MEQGVGSGDCNVVGIGRPTITTPAAASKILAGESEVIAAHQIGAGMRSVLGRVADLKMIDGGIGPDRHNYQLNRLGQGLEPDLNRGTLAATISMIRKYGRTSVRRKRGI
ncbi:hypothetical protein EFK50_13240 [Nocardioides marmoriginsengisoli]|uniref:Uncharacterized protein n=1 Tax=Nocardioides marmoriginsengisoli TaxID=661483 RepID=A0A3N0CGY5_9ACTN|nr:hypothetical protein [Nocardioides marmoriginsengisoli]RNL62710.1 hypothetical protein EFK50_13240 [Nocardioides marmoriginsengisoli]